MSHGVQERIKSHLNPLHIISLIVIVSQITTEARFNHYDLLTSSKAYGFCSVAAVYFQLLCVCTIQPLTM
jgi:hypothetical protein